MSRIKIEEILAKLNNVKKTGVNQYIASCPCSGHTHGDKNPSLSIKEGKEGQVVTHCHGGHNYYDVLAALNITYEKADPAKELYPYNKATNIYTYRDEKGHYLYDKVRLFKDGKKTFMLCRKANDKVFIGLEEGYYKETFEGSNVYTHKEEYQDGIYMQKVEHTLYNLKGMLREVEKNRLTSYIPVIFIVEGEKDVETMKKLGYVSVSAPNGGGNSKWNENFNKYFKALSVIIIADNDEVGVKHANNIARQLKTYAHKVKVIDKVTNIEKGDVTDLFESYNKDIELTKNSIVNISKKYEWKYAEWYRPVLDRDGNTTKLDVNTALLSDILSDRLDFKLFADPEEKEPDIYQFQNGVYKKIHDNWLYDEINSYLAKGFNKTSYIDDVFKRILKKIPLEKTLLNSDANYINFKNGLFNLETFELEKHNPNIYNTMQIDANFTYEPKNHGYFDSFINTLSGGNEEFKRLVYEIIGLSISNIDASKCKALFVLYGEGNTGKSQLLKLIKRLIGRKHYKELSLEKLGDRFALADLENIRVIGADELPECHLSASTVSTFKAITGGGDVLSEQKNKAARTVKFNGLMLYCTNVMPTISSDNGKHVYSRFKFLECNNIIPENQRDPNIIDKLMLDADYIVYQSLLVLYDLMQRNYKLTSFKESDDLNNLFAIESDSVRLFIEEQCEITNNDNDKIVAKTLYERYSEFCNDNGYHRVTSTKFGNRIKNINGITKNRASQGNIYSGIKAY